MKKRKSEQEIFKNCVKRNLDQRKQKDTLKIITKRMDRIKSFAREICIGVIVGIILLGLTLIVNNYISKKSDRDEMIANLSSVQIGLPKSYIDNLFGTPMVEFETDKPLKDKYSDVEKEYVSAGYKLDDCVLLCLYGDDNIIAFAVVVNSDDIYEIPYNMFMNERSLLDFTYAEFSEDIQVIVGNKSVAGDTYSYYYEKYGNGRIGNFNHCVLGNYKDYQQSFDVGQLMDIGQLYCSFQDYFHTLPAEELENYYELRKRVRPNFFGVIADGYEDEIDFVMDIVDNKDNAAILFTDW